jgi:hypothetical protein
VVVTFVRTKIKINNIDRYFGSKADAKLHRHFSDEDALALLLLNEQVFLNDHWWERDWPEDARKQTSINANCNDVFAWGFADAEGVKFEDIEDVYKHFIKDPEWGVAVWCIKKRGIMPQRPVAERISEAGIWNLASMGLEENPSEAHYRKKTASTQPRQGWLSRWIDSL